MDFGVNPRRRRPDRVGMRGSSQPLTWPSSTSSISLRLLSTVYSRFRRANSYWRGREGVSRLSINQSYNGRWSSNSRLHSEWVTCSSASDRHWVKSYMGYMHQLSPVR